MTKDKTDVEHECPFCGRDPFHYVDTGFGPQAAAVDCCELGDLYFRGAREPITHDVIIKPDDFRELGATISRLRTELSAARAALTLAQGWLQSLQSRYFQFWP